MGAECSTVTVQPGDLCGALASRCGISTADLYKYNPGSTFCNTLQPGQLVCCSEGSLPDLKPKPNPDGTCAAYTVQPGEGCSAIGAKFQLSNADIDTFNSKTWGWNGCDATVPLGAVICVSTGDPPMPAVIENAVCGPQVSGTPRPSDWSQIASLNPCPLNACCNTWGQCGITPEYCTPPKSKGQRRCLNMRADQIPSGYSHVHFSFAGITPNFTVDLSGATEQFQLFVKQTGFKKILAFGGWSDTNHATSPPIFHETVTNTNRLTFARSIVALVEQHHLDGVDFDWEYPGAVDLGGSAGDGARYLTFLRIVRQLLPAGKTISLAAPASFFYLQGYPLAAMADVVDYVVYMAYDLHGAWDYGSGDSQSGCPGGDCLRSHVNGTETEWALALATKAGVPSAKLVVGLASYGRSFKMADRECRADPMCRYVGGDGGAGPVAGLCTRAAGMVAQAELEDLKRVGFPGAVFWYDQASDSDMAQVMTDTWAAYMSEETKERRRARYKGLNFGGSADWAIDLAAFVPGDSGIRNKTAKRGVDSFVARRAGGRF
ncbi:glycoside hydrolase superfamily [Chaetomium tenue]|uniref:Glycoside hydrolase superfamily n=1 Tax=Chaetomium tenue TaxID=1854479 RepID=A0ACB7PBH9_9PEZI|nr:glycoside hydrolase superfamily [Chaetomium globosum]